VPLDLLPQFLRWYRESHLPTVMAIPGIVKAFRAQCRRYGITWAAVYQLRDEGALQLALESAQAQKAREEWQAWLPFVGEISVEVLAGLVPLPAYHHWN